MKNLAFLGLGTMGAGMANNLHKAGYSLTVWNRDAAKAKKFRQAKHAKTPAEAVQGADCVLYSLSNEEAIEEVVFGSEGILQGIEEGQTALDFTTVLPETSLRQAAAYKKKKVAFMDTPVFGSKNEAAEGGLWVLAGGEKAVFEKVKPLLEAVSETVHYMGKVGQGSAMKLVGNLIVAAQLQALGEALTLATKAGLKLKDVLGVLKVTDFRSPILENTTAAVGKRNFEPSFALKLMLKDANLIGDFAKQLNVAIPAAAIARETIKGAVNQGWGEENASALIKMLELQSGVTIS